jgi:ribosomal protein S18 acetylase RimI-like enzyme
MITTRMAEAKDIPWIKETMEKDWGGEPLLVRDKKYYPTALAGILAFDQAQNHLGFLFFEISDKTCEIVVFEIFQKLRGIGTLVLSELKDIAKQRGCDRISLMTHNDNLDALRFYQRRGFHICGIHLNSMEKIRKLKPCIPLTGDYGIPIRDEIDLEILLED